MSHSATGWCFSSDFDDDRQAALSQPISFEELMRAVVEDIEVVRAIAEPGRSDGLKNCYQPVFFVDLPNTGDALFNSSVGYRAQYWSDPWRGLAANSALLSALTPKLIAEVSTNEQPNLAKIDIRASLRAVSAKIWIRETSLNLEQHRDLAVEPWVTQAENGEELAIRGLSAPLTSKFEVKGALLDPFGNERVPKRKIGRHFDIHYYGFS